MIMVQESQTLSQGANEQVPSGKGRAVKVAAVVKRRQFSTAYKRQIVRKAATCEAVGGIGKLLRQEGLYSSHLAKWRRELEADERAALTSKRRGPKVDVAKAEARRIAVLEHEVNWLRLKLGFNTAPAASTSMSLESTAPTVSKVVKRTLRIRVPQLASRAARSAPRASSCAPPECARPLGQGRTPPIQQHAVRWTATIM